MKGAANPARLPTELMKAMPPAAAVPVRKEAGIDQNTGKAARMPMVAKLNATMANTGCSINTPVATSPTPAISVA
ncbi:hypothetical protein D9M69_644420 [compost metagenome]